MTKINWERDRRRRSVSRPAEAHRDPDGQISYTRPADGRGKAVKARAEPRPKPSRPRRRRSSPDDAVCPICGYRLPHEVLANHMRNSHSGRHDHHHRQGRNRSRSRTVALVLSLLLGPWGVDRFYLGQPGQGLLKLISFGGCGLWWALDVLRIATGNPRDGRGRELRW